MKTAVEENQELLGKLAGEIDRFFNGDKRGMSRGIGWAILVFPYHEPGRQCDSLTNGIRDAAFVSLLRKLADDVERKTVGGETIQ